MNILLRPGKLDDAAVCGSICYQAFKTIAEQHNFPPDLTDSQTSIGLLSQLLAREDVYSVIAESDGEVLGSNFLWESSQIAGVGPITVDPPVQNSAVGRKLMEDVLRRAHERHFAGIRLVQSAYHNRSLALYTKLGFAAREPLSNLQGPAIKVEIPGYALRQAKFSDLENCNRLCVQVHGHDRGPELIEAIKQGTAMVVEHGDRITAYTTMIGFFGHAVGESNEDLKVLIAATPGFPSPGFMVPTRNTELLSWCLNRGLRIIQPMTLMSIGLYNQPAGVFLPSVIY
jgi:predicted N-acetyltransferase YhbS